MDRFRSGSGRLVRLRIFNRHPLLKSFEFRVLDDRQVMMVSIMMMLMTMMIITMMIKITTTTTRRKNDVDNVLVKIMSMTTS